LRANVPSEAILQPLRTLPVARFAMSNFPSFRWWLIALLCVAFGLRLGAGFWWQARLPAGVKFGFGDSEGYWELARTIARGRPYEYGPLKYKVFRTPGYPLVLAPLFVVSDEPPVMWGRALSAILATAAVGGVAALARLLFDERTALVAAAIAAVYPEAISLGAFVLSEAPFVPLMLLNLHAWAKAWRATESKQIVAWALVGGAGAGLATLMRPSWLLFVPFAAAIGIVFGPQRIKHLRIAAVMLAGLCVTMSPWWIRNAFVAGRFVPTSLQVGASLYDGLSPTATGASEMSFVESFVNQQLIADSPPGADTSGLFEDRLDARMREASVAWARQNPRRVAELAGTKLLRMWSPLPNATEFRGRALPLVLAITYTPVLLLAGFGAWKFARRDWPYLLLVLPAFYFTCLHVIFVSSIRYRQPAMLPLIVLAAAVLVGFVRGSRPRPSTPAGG
jgi:4-amino-4-deoxy-L-arabinose transferase-like glycosyltransferase